PALLYRWSLKSTCWLYFPLVYLFTYPKKRQMDENEWGACLVTELHGGRSEWLRRGVALFVVAATAYLTVSPEKIIVIKESGTLLHAPSLLYLWAFDFFNLAPWQWLSLASALVTATVFILSDKTTIIWNHRKKQDEQAPPPKAQTQWLYHLTRLRSGCTILFAIMAFGYAVLALQRIDPETLPSWLAFLTYLYGPYIQL
ncbi:MAG: hypothetical protein HQL52_10595, partial [Magnetococcales bacterium]|nr:hypothetical protein [Magnetococcales bacterium]